MQSHAEMCIGDANSQPPGDDALNFRISWRPRRIWVNSIPWEQRNWMHEIPASWFS